MAGNAECPRLIRPWIFYNTRIAPPMHASSDLLVASEEAASYSFVKEQNAASSCGSMVLKDKDDLADVESSSAVV